MALRKDTALTLTGSQPGGWELILGGSASRGLTRAEPLGIHSQPRGWERGNTKLWAYLSDIRVSPIDDTYGIKLLIETR